MELRGSLAAMEWTLLETQAEIGRRERWNAARRGNRAVSTANDAREIALVNFAADLMATARSRAAVIGVYVWRRDAAAAHDCARRESEAQPLVAAGE